MSSADVGAYFAARATRTHHVLLSSTVSEHFFTSVLWSRSFLHLPHKFSRNAHTQAFVHTAFTLDKSEVETLVYELHENPEHISIRALI